MTFCLLLFSIIQIVVLYGQCQRDWTSNVNFNRVVERVYYIGCVEVEWDYAPSGKNLVSGEPIVETSDAAVWLWGNGVDRIGSKYVKALYREFTDDCFTTQKPRTKDEEHLGALGPNIRALTDEKIKIFYKNMCRIPTSIHGHGVAYDKTSEGAPYNDNDGVTGGDSVAPNGGKWIYIWHARPNMVDEGASSKMWIYHSHVDPIKDTYAGLFGAIIITRSGFQTSSTNLMPNDINREFTTFMVLYDENESALFGETLIRYLRPVPPISRSLLSDPDFIESNLMHAINGYLFGNLDDLIMYEGEKVRWYTASFGNEGDGPHSPHWHGNIAIDSLGDNTDTLVLIPGTTYTVTMTVDALGIWLYHCHVHDHIIGGMITTYTVLPEIPPRVVMPILFNLASYYCGFSTKEICSNVVQRIENPKDGFLFECDAPYACSNSNFDIELNRLASNVDVFQGILCKTSNACNGAIFTLANYQLNGLLLQIEKIDCEEIGSCNNMEINISSNVKIMELDCHTGRCDGCTINVIDSPSTPPISCYSLQGRSYP